MTTRVAGDAVTVTARARGEATVTVTAADPGGLEAAQRFRVVVPNRAPEAAGAIPPATVEAGDSVVVDASAHFTDPDRDGLSYSVESSDTSVATASAAGNMVTVVAISRGTATVTVTATDPEGLAATQSLEIRVPNRSPQPVGAIPDADLAGGSLTLDVSLYFDDPDGDSLVYEAESSAPGVATASVSGSVVTVEPVARGSATISVSARDPEGSRATQEFDLTVPNQPPVPVGTIPDHEFLDDVGNRRHTVDVSPYFRDPEGASLDYSVRTGNHRVATASILGRNVTVRAVARGTATIVAIARDPARLETTQEFTVTVPNSRPRATGTIADLVVTEGDEVEFSLLPYFTDPDRDALDYAVRTSAASIVSAGIRGTNLSLKGLAVGSARVTVTARDPYGLEAEQEFGVKVEEPRTGFDIRIAFTDSVPSSRRSAIRSAVNEWMAILADTDLPSVSVNDKLSCVGTETDQTIDSVDDMFITFHAEGVDGPGGTIAWAGMCALRRSPNLPYHGLVVFDTDDIDTLAQSGDLQEVAFHEIAHALGFGVLWGSHNLTASGASGSYFTGAGAVAAFDQAGGTAYSGDKVPTDGRHWRQSVLGREIMVPLNLVNYREPYSAISLQSMADLGYAVNAGRADPYRLPSTQFPAAADADDARAYDLRDDIRMGPVPVVDEDGRVVRVLEPDGTSVIRVPERTTTILARTSSREQEP